MARPSFRGVRLRGASPGIAFCRARRSRQCDRIRARNARGPETLPLSALDTRKCAYEFVVAIIAYVPGIDLDPNEANPGLLEQFLVAVKLTQADIREDTQLVP